jgi:initiation factor 1A
LLSKKVLNEGELSEMVLPSANDISAVATNLLGFDRARVKCPDDHERLCRIHGDINRRVWICAGNVFLVSTGTFGQIHVETWFGVTLELKLRICVEEVTLPSNRSCVGLDGY